MMVANVSTYGHPQAWALAPSGWNLPALEM